MTKLTVYITVISIKFVIFLLLGTAEVCVSVFTVWRSKFQNLSQLSIAEILRKILSQENGTLSDARCPLRRFITPSVSI